MQKHSRKISISVVFVMFLLVSFIPEAQSQDERMMAQGDRNARGIESKADRRFARQDFDKAMEIYETAFKDNTLSPDYAVRLHLKTARLYLTLLEYTSAIPHYDAAMALNDNLFTTSDVCNYLDALRFSGSKMKAIGLARKYAYRDAYNVDRRFQNILHALNYEEGILPIGTAEFTVYPMEKLNTANSEFWIGEVQGDYFYATSNSRFHDPHKKFYHRTQYLPLSKNAAAASGKGDGFLLDRIPQAMQNGAFTVSGDMSYMIITGVQYERGGSISITGEGINEYRVKLYTSKYNSKRKGWSSFSELFRGKEGYSFSHPFLFNDDQSLLFASDMPGGFGGFDLYVMHWNEEKKDWGLPVNLGSYVNTAGDEIIPYIFENTLIFSSNGHIGFGGYDLYGVEYIYNKITVGSLTHYSYPVNTVFNDFNMVCVDQRSGYIISDRNPGNKDDIYYFERNIDFGGLGASYALSGNQMLFNNMTTLPLGNEKVSTATPRVEELGESTLSELALSLYFDFDSYSLNKRAIDEFKAWTARVDVSRIESFLLEGYADEFGGEDYNMELSKKRADTVAGHLRAAGINVDIKSVGKGMIPMLDSLKGGSQVIDYDFQSNALKKPVWLTKEARRVDIIATIK